MDKSKNFSHADLRHSNFRNADLRGADLNQADLTYADLRGADLRGADLRGAWLGNAAFEGAQLQGADFRGANLWEVDLRGCDLRGCDFTGADLRETLGGPPRVAVAGEGATISAFHYQPIFGHAYWRYSLGSTRTSFDYRSFRLFLRRVEDAAERKHLLALAEEVRKMTTSV